MENCSQTILLTGRRGVGKTTVCQAVAELARRRGYQPEGVITPALYACPERRPEPVEGPRRRACPERRPEPVEGPRRRACPADWKLGIENWELTKVGFEAMDVGSGQRWPLARTTRELGGPQVGPYSFDPAALDKALRVLRRAATSGCDLFMVDEIGPLELEQGKGFAPVLDLLPVEGPMHTLIVVRPALLDQLLLHLRETSPVPSPALSKVEGTVEGFATPSKVFSVTEGNRDELPLRIVEALWGDQDHCSVR